MNLFRNIVILAWCLGLFEVIFGFGITHKDEEAGYSIMKEGIVYGVIAVILTCIYLFDV